MLLKLQEKHGFQGGATAPGPFDDVPPLVDMAATAPSPVGGFCGGTNGTPRGTSFSVNTLKRKASFSFRELDATGGATHGAALQHPSHYCAPLVVREHDIEFSPYGNHIRSNADVEPQISNKKPKTTHDAQLGARTSHPVNIDFGIIRSTEPIEWADIANMFQSVDVPDQLGTSGSQDCGEGEGRIFAPVTRKVNRLAGHRATYEVWSDSDTECDGMGDAMDDEDLTDEAVLARHQIVLDHMKKKLDVAIGQRKRLRSVSSSTSLSRGGDGGR